MIHSERPQVPEPFQTSSRLQTSRPRHTHNAGLLLTRLLDLSGAFKTTCGSAVIVPPRQPGKPGNRRNRRCRPPAAAAGSPPPTLDLETDVLGTGLEGRRASVGPEMSIKRRLLSMLLCCVYCVASLFCLHPNRHNCFSSGAR